MPRHAMPCDAMPCHAMPRDAMPLDAMPRDATHRLAMPRRAVPRPAARRARRLLVAPLLLLAVALGGCAEGAQSSGAPSQSSMAGVVSAASLPKSAPLSIDIPKIDARSTLLSLGFGRHRGIQLPPASTPMQAGWFSGGPVPGEIGPAVIFGHVAGDHQEGIFSRLGELVPGDLVLIKRQDGSTATFRVTHIEELSKGSFPIDAVHGDTTDAELRLVTCGRTFDQIAQLPRQHHCVRDAGRQPELNRFVPRRPACYGTSISATRVALAVRLREEGACPCPPAFRTRPFCTRCPVRSGW